MKALYTCCTAAVALFAAAAASAALAIDGSRDVGYCAPLVVQDTSTNFGNNNLGQVDVANGSELDNASARIDGGVLYLHLAGNLESNFNKLEIFFDSVSGGQNRLRGDNVGGVNRMGDSGSGNGLTFDAGFEADYWLSVTCGGGPFGLYVDYARLRTDSDPGDGYYVGHGLAANQTAGGLLDGGNNPFGILCTLNNSNTAGVSGGAGIGDSTAAALVTTGVEWAIPLAALGDPAGDVRICAFINGQQHDFVSNQVLGGIFALVGDNLGEPRNVNFANIGFDQFFTVPASAPQCGACCDSFQSCSVGTASDCANSGGTYQGDNTSCDGNPCDTITTGACCLSGTCQILSLSECAFAGGLYQGDDTTCTAGRCQPCANCGPGPNWIDTCQPGIDNFPTGALVRVDMDNDCEADATVTLNGPMTVRRTGSGPGPIQTEILSMHLVGAGSLIAGAGQGQGGVLAASLGETTQNPGDPMLADSFFDVFFELDLGGGQRVYNHSPLRVSASITCVPPDQVFTFAGCLPLFTQPVGGVQVAQIVEVLHDPFPSGACCFPNGDCQIRTEDECSAQGGTFQGPGTDCDPNPCPQPLGACCLEGQCEQVTRIECANAGGLYLGDNSACEPGICDSGACCLGDYCVEIREFVCAAIGGAYQGDNTTCGSDPCGAPSGQPTVDGACDTGYGAAVATQNTQTQFGDSNLGQVGPANGSELDEMFCAIAGNRLYLHISGNLESNFNKLEIFFDTRAGGQNRLRGDNPNVDFNGLNRMGDNGTGNGMTFDEGCDVDYYLSATGGGSPYTMYVNYAELASADGSVPGIGRYLGNTGAGSNGVLQGGDNPDHILVTINNSNTAGVTGGTGPADGSGVTTGFEASIPLAAIGLSDASQPFKVVAFVNGGGHDFVSNQVLGGIGGGENLADPRNVNFALIAGDQCVLVNHGAACIVGDANCDGLVDNGDIDCFVAALLGGGDPAQWQACAEAATPGCTYDFVCTNDINRDSSVDNGDIDSFVNCLINQPPAGQGCN